MRDDVKYTAGGNVNNPRTGNGSLRKKHRARLRAMGLPCGICKGRLGPIHYDEPSDSRHPLSFVIDEIKPISLYKQFGYASRKEAAEDFENLQPAHYCCNAAKSNKVGFSLDNDRVPKQALRQINISDGEW